MRTGFAVAVAAAAVIEAAAAKDQKVMRMRTGFAAAVAAAGIAAAAAAVAKGRKAMKMRKATPCQYTVADSIAVESQKERHPEMVENSTGPKPKCVVAIFDRKKDCFEARSVLGWHTGLTLGPAAEEPAEGKGCKCHSTTGSKPQIAIETMA